MDKMPKKWKLFLNKTSMNNCLEEDSNKIYVIVNTI